MKLRELPLDDLIIGKRHRKVYLEIEELAQSILKQGLLQPLIINQRNEILAGGRRYHAFKLLQEQGTGPATIPCVVYENTSQTDQLCVELLENLQRSDFTWQEQVTLVDRVHKALVKENGNTWTMEQTADRLGMSKSAVSKDLKIARDMSINPAIASAETKSKASFMIQNAMRRLESVSNVASLSDSDMDKLKAIVNCQSSKCGMTPDLTALQLQDFEIGCGCDTAPPQVTNYLTPTGTPTTHREAGEGGNGNGTGQSTGKKRDAGEPPLRPAGEVQIEATQNEESEPERHIPPMSYHNKCYREILESIPDGSIGLVEMDPPYAIDFDKTYGKSQGLTSTLIDWDVPKFKEEMSFLIPEIMRVLIPNSWCLLWTAYEHLPFLEKEAKKARFIVQRPGVWVKPTGTGNHPKKRLLSNVEWFLLLGKGDPAFMTSYMLQGVIQKSANATDKIHTTEKPISLYDEIFSAIARPNTLFFTPFAGSGNSMIAAAKKGMSGLGTDTDPQYKTFFESKIVKEFF